MQNRKLDMHQKVVNLYCRMHYFNTNNIFTSTTYGGLKTKCEVLQEKRFVQDPYIMINTLLDKSRVYNKETFIQIHL